MLSGELPFRSRSLVKVMEMKLREELPPVRQLAPAVSPAVAATVHRALSADPNKRPSSCLEFLADLNDATSAPPPPPRPHSERRVSVRYSSKQDGSCVPVGGELDCRWPAKIVDVSLTGLSLLLGRRFEPNALLLIQPVGDDPALPRTLLVRVRNARPQPRRKWLLGCAFARRLSEDEMRLLL